MEIMQCGVCNKTATTIVTTDYRASIVYISDPQRILVWKKLFYLLDLITFFEIRRQGNANGKMQIKSTNPL